MRNSQGEFSSFDPPGSLQTYPSSIDAAGIITGYYEDAASIVHGFVRSRTGEITTFDAPDSTQTVPQSINAQGATTGNGSYHAFVRNRQGEIVTFDYPGGANTIAWSINDLGAVTGSFGNTAGLTLGSYACLYRFGSPLKASPTVGERAVLVVGALLEIHFRSQN